MISSPRSEFVSRRATDGPAFVQARYGTARGLVRLLLSRAAQAAGAYRSFQRIDWAKVERLVFVCSGNICRSPYAEHRAARAGIASISLALRGDSRCPADPAASAAAGLAGIDLSAHRSLAVDEAELRPGDLLVAMEPWQARRLGASFPELQVTLLGLWTRPKRPHLHDPFSLGDAYFRTCFRLIDTGVAALLGRIGR